MRVRWVAAAALVLLLTPGCGDSDGGNKDSAPASDAGTKEASALDIGIPDVTVDTTVTPDGPPAESNMGEGCTTNAECKKGSPTCVLVDTRNRIGICSKTCTPDDGNTPLINEDDCADGFVCGAFRFNNNQTYNYCLKKCTPSLTKNPCPTSSKQTCDPASTRFSGLDQTVCWFLSCKTNKDCPVNSAKTCVTDADCTAVASDAFCENRVCARPGNCTPGGICGPHKLGKAAAKPGDPCSSDLDCGNNGFCLTQDDTVAQGPSYRNGYCTIRACAFSQALPEFACPTGSTCHNLFFGGLCHKTCKTETASDCRNGPSDKGGDYECYAWDNLSIGGVNVTTEPVCQTAVTQTCDSLGTQLDCTSLAPQGNAQQMSCRDRKTGQVKTMIRDPTGLCLDNTASGPFDKPGDAGVGDSATSDSAAADSAAADSAAADSAAADSAAADSAAADSAAADSAAGDSAGSSSGDTGSGG